MCCKPNYWSYPIVATRCTRTSLIVSSLSLQNSSATTRKEADLDTMALLLELIAPLLHLVIELLVGNDRVH